MHFVWIPELTPKKFKAQNIRKIQSNEKKIEQPTLQLLSNGKSPKEAIWKSEK